MGFNSGFKGLTVGEWYRAPCCMRGESHQSTIGSLVCQLFSTLSSYLYVCVCVCVWEGGWGNDRSIFQINVWTLIQKASVNYWNCSPGYSDSGQDCGRTPQKINYMYCRCADDWVGGRSIRCAGSCVCVCVCLLAWHTMCVREDLFNWRKKIVMRARLRIN